MYIKDIAVSEEIAFTLSSNANWLRVSIDASVYFKIQDPRKAIYRVFNYEEAVKFLATKKNSRRYLTNIFLVNFFSVY